MEKPQMIKRSIQAVSAITTLIYTLIVWLVGFGNDVTLSYTYAAKFVLNIGALAKNLSVNVSPGIRIGWPIFKYHYWNIIITPAVIVVLIAIAISIEFIPYFKKKKKVQDVQDKIEAPHPSEFVPTTYKLMFQGELQPGAEIESVKKKVAQLYRIPMAKCDKLFSGSPVVIKDNLDKLGVQKYKSAFEETGAKCRVHVSK